MKKKKLLRKRIEVVEEEEEVIEEEEDEPVEEIEEDEEVIEDDERDTEREPVEEDGSEELPDEEVVEKIDLTKPLKHRPEVELEARGLSNLLMNLMLLNRTEPDGTCGRSKKPDRESGDRTGTSS